MENQTPQVPSKAAAIDLDISGPGFMLNGRFVDWESGVTMGPDLDQLQVRLAIDATSARIDSVTPDNAALFSFRGRDAAPISEGLYQIDGELTGASGSRPLRAQVETPIEHSAVFLLSFQARKSDFGPRWTRLLSNVIDLNARNQGATMPAHGWLTIPQLAAA